MSKTKKFLWFILPSLFVVALSIYQLKFASATLTKNSALAWGLLLFLGCVSMVRGILAFNKPSKG